MRPDEDPVGDHSFEPIVIEDINEGELAIVAELVEVLG